MFSIVIYIAFRDNTVKNGKITPMTLSERTPSMHVLFAVSLFTAAWFKADWRNWQQYHSTLLYIGFCNLLYNLLCQDYLLWKYKPDFLLNHQLTDLVYTIIILPSIAFVYLSNYPDTAKKKQKVFYIIKWVTGSLLVEGIFLLSGHLDLRYGYEYWMEVFFYPCMYIMLKLHLTRPLTAYALSILVIVFMMALFNVPLK
jgi:hypothetical protein